MSPEEMERLLASALTRRLSPEAEQRILGSIASAAVARPSRWWMRRVLLWQAAAACLVVCLATLGGVRAFTAERSSAPDPSQTRAMSNDEDDEGRRLTELVRMDKAIFGTPTPPVYQIDIAKWQFQPATTE